MTVFIYVAMLVTISYHRALIPLARRATGLDRGISFLHRMGIGFAISTLITGLIEVRRKEAAAAAAGVLDKPTAIVPISVLWLVPQYALHGVAEAFTSIGHLEFFYDQAPESMRSTATALFWLSKLTARSELHLPSHVPSPLRPTQRQVRRYFDELSVEFRFNTKYVKGV